MSGYNSKAVEIMISSPELDLVKPHGWNQTHIITMYFTSHEDKFGYYC